MRSTAKYTMAFERQFKIMTKEGVEAIDSKGTLYPLKPSIIKSS